MDYVTTNVRLFKDDYQKLKSQAALQRKSLSAVIREKLATRKQTRSKTEIEKLMKELDNVAKENSKYLKGFDSVKALRELRYEGKW